MQACFAVVFFSSGPFGLKAYASNHFLGVAQVVFPGDTLAPLRLSGFGFARHGGNAWPCAVVGSSLSFIAPLVSSLGISRALAYLPPHVEVFRFSSLSRVIKLPQLAPLFSVFPLSSPPRCLTSTWIISRDESHFSHIHNQMPPRSSLLPQS
jgi:hypothetical protein